MAGSTKKPSYEGTPLKIRETVAYVFRLGKAEMDLLGWHYHFASLAPLPELGGQCPLLQSITTTNVLILGGEGKGCAKGKVNSKSQQHHTPKMRCLEKSQKKSLVAFPKK